jgi:hypothetical protein
MSAIVAAMVAAREAHARTCNPDDAILLAWGLDDACKAIVRASNAAGAGLVVEGAPRTWAVRWLYSAWRGWFATADRSCVGVCVGYSPDRDQRLRPTWDAANRLWVWSTAAHDPRPCAWPRPFARGVDR